MADGVLPRSFSAAGWRCRLAANMRQTNETRLELRARKLGDAISRRVDTIATGLRPPGQRPSFNTMLSEKNALNWWLKNWGNPDTGQKVLAVMDPASQLELHAALSQHIEQNNLMPATQMGATMDQAGNMAAGPMTTPNLFGGSGA